MNKNLIGIFLSLTLVSLLAVGCSQANKDNSRDQNPASGSTADNRSPEMRGTTPRDDRNLSREDFEKRKNEYERDASQQGRRVGSGADDLWIWTKTRAALGYADDLRDSSINVDVDQNVVTLTGTVPTEAQKARAAEIARGLEGVRSVKNELQVGGTGAGDMMKRSPDAMKDKKGNER